MKSISGKLTRPGRLHEFNLLISAAFIFAAFYFYAGCIPNKIVIDAPPPEGQTNFSAPAPANPPAQPAGNNKPRINMAQTENFYVAVMDVNISANISESMKMPLTLAIIGELVAMNRFKVIDRMNRDSILAEQGFQQTGCVDNSCSVQAGRLLGVNRIVVASVNLIGSIYNISIQVLNVETGQIEAISEKAISCRQEDLPGWVKLTTRGLFI